ncbi:MAG: phosphotransferase [Bacillota bacterium]
MSWNLVRLNFPDAVLISSESYEGTQQQIIVYHISCGGRIGDLSVVYKQIDKKEYEIYRWFKHSPNPLIPKIFYLSNNEIIMMYVRHRAINKVDKKFVVNLSKLHGELFKLAITAPNNIPTFSKKDIEGDLSFKWEDKSSLLLNEERKQVTEFSFAFLPFAEDITNFGYSTIIHNDLDEHNILLETGTNKYFIIDWGKSRIGNPLLDLAWLFDWGEASQLYQNSMKKCSQWLYSNQEYEYHYRLAQVYCGLRQMGYQFKLIDSLSNEIHRDKKVLYFNRLWFKKLLLRLSNQMSRLKEVR